MLVLRNKKKASNIKLDAFGFLRKDVLKLQKLR